MSITSQIQNNTDILLHNDLRTRVGQKVTIVTSTITHLAFYIRKIGTPQNLNVTFAIRKVSDDSIMGSKVWGLAQSLPTSNTWEVVQFDSPVDVNQAVRFSIEYAGTTDYPNSCVVLRYQNTDVAASENLSIYPTGGPWSDVAGATFDCAYYFQYTSNPVLTVTTQAMSAISTTTATGNGRIEAFGTDGSCTQHGHCWATLTNPTTTDNKTTLGAKSTSGSFTSSLTSLTPGVTYYVRAYATDSVSTYYGVNVAFIAGQAILVGSPNAGNIFIFQTELRYIGDDGKEYYIQGTAV